ncbi:DUF2235 domain-containing protein [Pseudoalteromonas sp. NEC-BIFX-2020_002]|uniref:phospholipase effector Tle1 domain-containing protein n=1 Tax=Pseudoalteromonas sp. NEC-BIFX-2020_002 TaxID=2732353 RepID=UPI0014771FD9|nr:DUF2235 domain-containing protein [Pseudoalteromonas sp. NEC-BIFX-2020_002]NNG41741.1 DUF2235 domain-containing protein [Pseudoalteromonas sp. NEC-BIFX-2020_002]
MAPKTLIFNFDGTGSEPRDAEQFSSDHFKEDASISNILKLHLLLGGTLNTEKAVKFESQHSFYYQGIGTKGSRLKRVLNQTFAPRDDDVASILNHAISDFKKYYVGGDTVLLTGFSRGAALARRFAKCLEALITHHVYLCVFDTVASIGLSKVTKATRGAEHVIFENHTLANNITQALHCVALDEKRRAFEPTLINYQQNVQEVWFAGAHSDIGGGYYRDGLADICLRFAIEWLLEQPLSLHFLTSQAIDYQSLFAQGQHALIAQDDMTVTPDPFALSHQQNYFWFNPFFKLVDRECIVLVNDEKSELLPHVHHSVAKRIHHLTSYRPESLKSLPYQLLYADQRSLNFIGFRDHIALVNQNMTVLQIGQHLDVMIYAAEQYNATGLMLEQGATYRFQAYPEQQWYDDGIKCGPQGWHRDGVRLGVKEISMAILEPFRRLASAQWFALIGAINYTDDDVFEISAGGEFKMTKSGEFTPFANDLMRFYGANAGHIRLNVTRLG